MNLQFLNDLKKGDKKLRKKQNKRYREKYKEILNLKKQRAYHKKILEKNLQKNVLLFQTKMKNKAPFQKSKTHDPKIKKAKVS